MSTYELVENEWLIGIYEIREKWVPVYHLDTFYAGTNTTGRSEGMNSFYKNFFSPTTTLREFVLKNDRCLSRIVEREKKEDYTSEHSNRIVDSNAFLLKSAAKMYTRNAYDKFKREYDKAQAEYVLDNDEKGSDGYTTYIYKSRVKDDQREWKVKFNPATKEGNCECKLFEFLGIPCGHLVKVFQCRDLEIPGHFILKRWMKGANKYRVEYDGGLVSGHESSELLRTIQLQMIANQLVYEAAETDETYQLMLKRLQELSLELKETNNTNDRRKISIVDSCTVNENSQDAIGACEVLLLNPNISQTKGRKKEVKVYNKEVKVCNGGTSGSRIRGGLETSIAKANKAKTGRRCTSCNKVGVNHDKRNCPETKKITLVD
jgi:hypothetical protein